MLLAINAVLYLAALTLSLCVLTPLPEAASRRVRVARIALALGGGCTITAAITLTFLGLWVESALSSSESDDGEDGSDGGGGRPRDPVPPAPPEPLAGPDLDWGEFDRARAGWSHERKPIPA